MWLTFLSRRRDPFSQRPHAQPHTRRRTPFRHAPSRPLVEQLEDRTVPSGGVVGNLVIFGDSLSDTGNFIPNIPAGSLPPPIAQSMALYYQGRMSDGPIWVDALAKYLGEPPVQPSSVGGLNYAVSGANVLYP